MADKITWNDKSSVIPKGTREIQVWDDDMNEIKTVVNTNADELDATVVRVDNLEENQVTGVVQYSTLAELPTTGTLNVSYKVTNDGANNGYYHWNGSSYIKDDDPNLTQTIEPDNTTEAPSNKAVYNEFTELKTVVLDRNATVGKSINPDGSIINATSAYCMTDVIYIVGKTLSLTGFTRPTTYWCNAYDIDGTIIDTFQILPTSGNFASTNVYEYELVDGAYSIQISFQTHDLTADIYSITMVNVDLNDIVSNTKETTDAITKRIDDLEVDYDGQLLGIDNEIVNIKDYEPYNGLDNFDGFMNVSGGLQSSSPYTVTGYMRVYGDGISITNTIKGLASTIYCGAYDIDKNLLYTFQILPTTNHTLEDIYYHVYTDVNVAYIRVSLQDIDVTTFKLRCTNITEIPTDVIFEELKNKELRIRTLESENASSEFLSYLPELYQPPFFVKSSKTTEDFDFDGVNRTVNDIYNAFDRLADAHKPYFRKLTKIGTSQVLSSGDFGYAIDQTIYDINLYELAKIGLSASAPTIIIGGSIHGCEEPSVFATYYAIRDILENFNKNKMLKYLYDNCRILIVPLQNPWGWQNHRRENGRNVDLNRNWDYNWIAYSGGSKGASPMSEAESQAMESLINSYLNTFCLLDLHSRGEDLIPTDQRFTGYANDGDILSANMFTNARDILDYQYITGVKPAINPYVSVSPTGGNPSLYRWAYYVKGISSSNPESVRSLNNEIETLWSLENNRQQTHYISLLIQFCYKIYLNL